MKRYFIGVGVVIVVLFLIFIFVLNRGDNSQPVNNKPKVVQLTDYSDTSSEVSLITIGKLVGDDEHRSILITVSASERRLEILSGYERQLISSQSFPNNQAAYEAFLSAIAGQGFISSKATNISDNRSICPTGQRYEYLVTENGQEKSNLWSVSCDKSGNFNGRASSIRQLFQRQIPEYNQQVRGISL